MKGSHTQSSGLKEQIHPIMIRTDSKKGKTLTGHAGGHHQQNKFNFNDIENLEELQENEFNTDHPFGNQQSNNLEQSDQKSNKIYEKRRKLNMSNAVESSPQGVPIMKGGVVTQGFMNNDKHRNRLKNRPITTQTSAIFNSKKSNPMETPPLSGLKAQTEMYQQNQPMPFLGYSSNQYPMYTDYQPQYMYASNPHISNAENQGNQYQNQPIQELRPPVPQQMYVPQMYYDPRYYEQNMMTMMMYQHNNFKAMMDSHTSLMTKMIDKMMTPVSRNYLRFTKFTLFLNVS